MVIVKEDYYDTILNISKFISNTLYLRKIDFIQEFLKIQNEELISRLEKLMRSDKTKEKTVFKPMSVEELNSRIDKSMVDSKNNRLTSSNDLVAEIEKWS